MMHLCIADGHDLGQRTRALYRLTLTTLLEARIPFLVGGGCALDFYTEIGRRTKDFDLFLRPRHYEPAMRALTRAGFDAERTFHWIGKVHRGDDLVDIIYSAVNGVPLVDDGWFDHAVAAEVL